MLLAADRLINLLVLERFEESLKHILSTGVHLTTMGVVGFSVQDLGPFLLAMVLYTPYATIALPGIARFKVSVEISGSNTQGSDALLHCYQIRTMTPNRVILGSAIGACGVYRTRAKRNGLRSSHQVCATSSWFSDRKKPQWCRARWSAGSDPIPPGCGSVYKMRNDRTSWDCSFQSHC
jgi:hypothetical protein